MWQLYLRKLIFMSKDSPVPEYLQWKEGELDPNRTFLFLCVRTLKSELGADTALWLLSYDSPQQC